MVDETTTEQLAEIEGQGDAIQVREGRWRTRNGDIRNVTPTPAYDSRAKRWPWRDAAYDQTWTPNGQNHFGCEESPSDLAEYLGPIEADKTQELDGKTQELPDKTQELPEPQPQPQPEPCAPCDSRDTCDTTTSEQLAELDRDMADIDRQVAELVEEAQRADYKTQELPEPQPEGWRVLQVGEVLRDGDLWVNHEGELWPTKRVGETVNDERYIRPIEPQPQPQPEPESIQVREGRWRQRNGDIRNVTPTPAGDGRRLLYPWWDAEYHGTWTWDGRYHLGEAGNLDLLEYLGPIEPEPESQPEPQPQAAAIEELRSEVSHVQNQLGESQQRVAHLQELVTSLRNINAAQEKAFTAAGKENNALRNQLLAVKAELVTQAETSRRLQIELDAAHQVPADSPELRQLRADLEQMTLGRDTYQDGYNRVLSDLETIRETTTADTVETIVEWLQAFRRCNSPALALLLLEALPSIMRSLTGLADEEIE